MNYISHQHRVCEEDPKGSTKDTADIVAESSSWKLLVAVKVCRAPADENAV